MSAKRAPVTRRPTRAEAVEPVRTPAERGWLTPAEAQAFLRETFGVSVSARTLQAWARDRARPLRHARMGHRLLIHRDSLLERVTE